MREGSYQSAHMHPPPSTTARDHTAPKQARNIEATRTPKKVKHKLWTRPKDTPKEDKDDHNRTRRSTAMHSFGITTSQAHLLPSIKTLISPLAHGFDKPRRCPFSNSDRSRGAKCMVGAITLTLVTSTTVEPHGNSVQASRSPLNSLDPFRQ